MSHPYAGSERLLALMFRALERGLADARDGLMLTFAIVVVDGQRALVRFVGTEASSVAAARVHVGGAGRWTERWAVVYDGWAADPGAAPTRALVVEAGEQGAMRGWRLVQRYERSEAGPLLLLGLPEWVGAADQLLERTELH